MAPPGQFFLFLTGNPAEDPATIIAAGHFALHIDGDGDPGAATGNVTIQDPGRTWVTHLALEDWSFNEEKAVFNATAVFTTVHGSPPFPPTMETGDLPVGVLVQSENNPNLFSLIVASSPPGV